jgi:hypothetical protein
MATSAKAGKKNKYGAFRLGATVTFKAKVAAGPTTASKYPAHAGSVFVDSCER